MIICPFMYALCTSLILSVVIISSYLLSLSESFSQRTKLGPRDISYFSGEHLY